jgi:hypothetical protein
MVRKWLAEAGFSADQRMIKFMYNLLTNSMIGYFLRSTKNFPEISVPDAQYRGAVEYRHLEKWHPDMRILPI